MTAERLSVTAKVCLNCKEWKTYGSVCNPFGDDPWRTEKEKRAAEVFERLRVASWHGRRANRAPQERETTTEGVRG